MTTRTKISACSIRISAVATPYGFKTIGSFHKFLKQCNPTAKLYYGNNYIRVAYMLKLVISELNTYMD